MKKKSAKPSPLERLVKAAQEKERLEAKVGKALPVKVQPKNRFSVAEPEISEVLIPIVEDDSNLVMEDLPRLSGGLPLEGVVVANSSLTLNFNFHVDDKAVDKAIETSKQVAKKIAAAGAAMLGTAFLLSENRTVDKVKIPLMPKIKLPKIKKTK